MAADDFESLRNLPIRRGVTWQGGLRRLPLWVTPEGVPPFRPRAAVWSSSVGKVHMGDAVDPAKASGELVVDAFVAFARHERWGGYLPARVEVTDSAEAALLEPALSQLGIDVAVTRRLRHVEDALDLLADEAATNPAPGMLDAPEMSLERVRSFAEAARLFYEAAPWRHFTDEDLLRVESPMGLRDARHGLVLGAGGQEFGLMLFDSPHLAEVMRRRPEGDPFERDSAWCVFFGPVNEAPLGDADIFEDHGFPVASSEAYPWPAQIGPKGRMRRPGVRALQHLEAVLRALAVSTEADIDTGRWTRTVPTADAEVVVTLAIPDLIDPPTERSAREPRDDRRAPERVLRELERFLARGQFEDAEDANRAVAAEFMGRPMDDIPSTAMTPLERAQDLCYRAFDARGRLQLKLARQALALSPDCADAYVILAERSQDPDETARFYEQGIAAGERALGTARFAKGGIPFWGDVSTRGFMRALMGLAQCRHAQNRLMDAIEIYRRMLELNPNDNQGARWLLVGLFLETGDDAGAADLLERFAEDDMATVAYSRALLAFRKGGDCPASRKALRNAMRANPHVPGLLIESLPAPAALPSSFSFGGEDEAAICSHEIAAGWTKTEGALAWLRKHTQAEARRPKRGRSRRGPS